MGSLKARKKSNKVIGKKNQNASEFEMTSHPSTVGYSSFLVSPSLTEGQLSLQNLMNISKILTLTLIDTSLNTQPS